MSIARIGTRATVVGLGVLASLAFTAAPSWAGGGNSANAKLCHDYPGALLAQDGSAFKNAGQCTTYASEGGRIAGVNAVASPAVGGISEATFSGFGLFPGEETTLYARYQPSGVQVTLHVVEEVGGNGAFSEAGIVVDCEVSENGMPSGKVSSLVVEAVTAAGTVFSREFPPPSGC